MADDKGKGKAQASSSSSDADQASKPSSGASNAAQTLASALRTSMASSQLGSLMQSASGGKAEFQQGSGGTAELRDWLIQDLRSSSSGGAGSAATTELGHSGFRTTQTRTQEQEGDMFADFERGLSLNNTSSHGPAEGLPAASGSQQLDRVWHDRLRAAGSSMWEGTGIDPRTARPLQSYTELDAPFHAAVRADYALPLAGPSVRPPPPAAVSAPLAQSDDIFALLDAESTSQPAPLTSTTDVQSEEVLSHFDPLYRPPSPSHPSFSRDQATAHLQLAEAQASEQGRQELAVPRPDNQAQREGVYALTAEDALRSIFEGRTESSEVEEKEVGERGKEVVRKITRYFGATSYLDDVYGVSPLLRETIEEASKEQTPDAEAEEKRLRAVRRLEALWGHLSNTPPAPNGSTDWVDSWLSNNT